MRIFLAGAVLNLALLGAWAAEKEASVDAVLDKYVKAIGGKEAWNKVETRKVKADFTAMGSTAEWSLETKVPNQQVTRVDLPGVGLIVEGFDGTTAWSQTPEGARIKHGDELQRARKQADVRREVRLKELYPSLVSKGKETLDGKQVQVLEHKEGAGSSDRFYFDVDSGLLVRQQAEFESQGTPILVDVRLDNYKPVDGIRYSHEQEGKIIVGGQPVFEFDMKVKEIKHNEKVDEAKFKKPAA